MSKFKWDVWGKLFYTEWNMLPGLAVESDIVQAFKRLLDGHIICKELKDMDHVETEEMSCTWYCVWHGYCAPKGLFRRCAALCSVYLASVLALGTDWVLCHWKARLDSIQSRKNNNIKWKKSNRKILRSRKFVCASLK